MRSQGSTQGDICDLDCTYERPRTGNKLSWRLSGYIYDRLKTHMQLPKPYWYCLSSLHPCGFCLLRISLCIVSLGVGARMSTPAVTMWQSWGCALLQLRSNWSTAPAAMLWIYHHTQSQPLEEHSRDTKSGVLLEDMRLLWQLILPQELPHRLCWNFLGTAHHSIAFFLPNLPSLPLSSQVVKHASWLDSSPSPPPVSSPFFPHGGLPWEISYIFNLILVSTPWRTQTDTPKKTGC